MKQNKQMYEAPKVELIEMETQGVLCGSGETQEMTGTGFVLEEGNGAWTIGGGV